MAFPWWCQWTQRGNCLCRSGQQWLPHCLPEPDKFLPNLPLYFWKQQKICLHVTMEEIHVYESRAVSRLAASQWEMFLQSNAVSHWLGANLESALWDHIMLYKETEIGYKQLPFHIDGLVQDCSNSTANAKELLSPCTKPLIYTCTTKFRHWTKWPTFCIWHF